MTDNEGRCLRGVEMLLTNVRNLYAALLFFPAVVVAVTAFIGSAACAATRSALSGRTVQQQARNVDSDERRKKEKA
jgi:hypothetical protein